MNRIARNSIVLILLIGLLGGGVWWVLNMEEPTTPTEQPEALEQETVYEVSEEEILGIEIESADGIMRFSKENQSWILEGYTLQQLSQFKMNSLVREVATLESLGSVDSNFSDCGLDTPKATIRILRTGGIVDVVKIGDMSPLLSTYFFVVNDEATIHTMLSDTVLYLLSKAEYYTDFSRLNLADMDISQVQIERVGHNTVHLYRKPAVTDAIESLWEVREPYRRPYDADDRYVQSAVLDKIGQVNLSMLAEGIGTFSPRAVVTVYAASLSASNPTMTPYVLKVGHVEGDTCYVSYKNEIFKVPAQYMDFVDVDETTLVLKLLALVPVQTLDSMTITSGTDVYEFQINHDAANENKLDVKINGKAADEQKAKQLYQQIIGIEAEGAYKDDPKGEVLAEIVFDSQGTKKIVTFCGISDLYATFTVDGNTEFTVKKKAVLDLMDQVKAFANNPV